MTDISQRELPHNYDAEQAVLGSIIIDPVAMHEVIDIVSAGDFFQQQHGEIFRGLVDLHENRIGIDILNLNNWLAEHGKYQINVTYLMELVNVVPTSINARHYAETVHGHAMRRFIIAQAGLMAAAAYDPEKSLDEVLGGAQSQLSDATQKTTRGALAPVKSGIWELMQKLDSPEPAAKVTFPWIDLNRMLESLTTFDGTLITLAARPGMGKTSALIDIARHVARQGKSVAFFNLEMSEEQLVTRMVSSMTGIDAGKIRQKTLRDDEKKLLYTAMGKLSELPIYIDDTAGQTIQSISAKCHRMRMTTGVDLVIVDYIQIMQAAGRFGNRNEEISSISRGLVILAKELGCPILAAAQLNRSVEQRADKHPVLADLRDSGAIEQDSAAVVFIYRDEYYNPDTDKQNIAELVIDKNRFGPTGIVELFWNGQATTFKNLQSNRIDL